MAPAGSGRFFFAKKKTGRICRFGGADGIRTHDLLNAIQALWPTELRPQNFVNLNRLPPISYKSPFCQKTPIKAIYILVYILVSAFKSETKIRKIFIINQT